jgi:hypothetical protein
MIFLLWLFDSLKLAEEIVIITIDYSYNIGFSGIIRGF